LKYTFSYTQLCLRRLGVKMSREIVTIVLIISVAIFVQYQIVPKYGQKLLKYGQMKPERLLVAWKNFYTELKTWSERMVNVDFEQLKPETETEDTNTKVTTDVSKKPKRGEASDLAPKEPRWYHPYSVNFRVGEIVRCIDGDKASGVIVGWDENIEDLTDETSNAIMPSEIRKAQQDKSKANLHLPHYLILMDSIEAVVTYDQLRYLAQSEIEAIGKPGKILNLAVGDYFERYHNGKYVMRPWLQNMYPRD